MTRRDIDLSRINNRVVTLDDLHVAVACELDKWRDVFPEIVSATCNVREVREKATVLLDIWVRVDGDIALSRKVGESLKTFFDTSDLNQLPPAGVQLMYTIFVRRDGPEGDADEAEWRLGGI